MQDTIMIDVRWENWTICAIENVALFAKPVSQMRATIVVIDNTEFVDIINAGVDGNAILK